MNYYKYIIIFFLFSVFLVNVSFAQEPTLHFFDLSKERNLDIIISQLKTDGFEEKNEKRKSDIPGICYTKSSEGLYVRFTCNYTPKTRQIASYWYKIYSGNSDFILKELNMLYGDYEYHTPNSYEWHFESADIKLKIGLDNWVDYSYEDETMNKIIMKEITPILSTDKLYGIIWIIGLCLLGIIIAYIQYKRSKKERSRTELFETKRKEEQEKIDTSHELYIKRLQSILGAPTRSIKIENRNCEGKIYYDDILVYQQYKKIIIGEKEFVFDDIVNCDMLDENQKVAPIIQTTKTKTGSMLARAAVGALTLGVAGAVVGAVTAEKESSSKLDANYEGSYVIKIGIKSIEEPTINLRFGSNKSKAEEVYSLMQAIIAMK